MKTILQKTVLITILAFFGLSNANAQIMKSSLTNTIACGFATQGNTIFVGLTGLTLGVYKSTDNGLTWSSVNNDELAKKEISSIATLDSILIVGTSDGLVFRTTDQGVTWNSTSNGLSGKPINGFVIFYNK